MDACPWGRAHTKNCLPMFGPSFFTVRSTQGSPWTLQEGGGGGPWSTDFQNPNDAPFLAAESSTVGCGVNCFVFNCFSFSSVALLVQSCGGPSKTGAVSSGTSGVTEEASSRGLEAFWGFCDDTTSRLSVFSHSLTGASVEGTTFVSLGLKKERRLPCGLDEVFTVFVFFPFGTTESDVNNRFLPDRLPAPDGYKFSLVSSSSWDPGNASLCSDGLGFWSTLAKKRESFCCLPANSGR